MRVFWKVLTLQTVIGPRISYFFPRLRIARQPWCCSTFISVGCFTPADCGSANAGKTGLYSLRHTAITFRLLFGRGIDLLTLARNARTSVEMIERFYASELSAEMNVALLHSRRSLGK